MLDDLRVVELSATSAAAFAGRFCADAGAEVILVEPPTGHALRYEGPFVQPSAISRQPSALSLKKAASLRIEGILKAEG